VFTCTSGCMLGSWIYSYFTVSQLLQHPVHQMELKWMRHPKGNQIKK
jgi:hypothetical protein